MKKEKKKGKDGKKSMVNKRRANELKNNTYTSPL